MLFCSGFFLVLFGLAQLEALRLNLGSRMLFIIICKKTWLSCFSCSFGILDPFMIIVQKEVVLLFKGAMKKYPLKIMCRPASVLFFF